MTTMAKLEGLEALILDAGARFSAQETLVELATVLESLHADGAEARDHQRCLHLIHLVNYKIDRFEEAFDYGYRALTAFPEIRHLSPNATLMFPYRMGECCLRLDHFEDAIPYYERTLNALNLQSSEESDAKLGTLEKIGYCLHHAGRSEEALEVNRGLLLRAEAFFGPMDPTLASVLTNLAANTFDTGDFASALAYLERGYEICAQLPEQAFEFLFQLGALCVERGDREKAMEWFQRQLAIAEYIESPDHIEEAWRNLEMLKAGAA